MSNRRSNHPTAWRYPVCTKIILHPLGNRYEFEEIELGTGDCVPCFERTGRITDHIDREDSCVLDEDGPF